MILLSIVAVFVVSLALTRLLIRYPLVSLMDIPGQRSLHVGAIPRSGGLAIVISWLLGVLWLSTMGSSMFSIACLLAVVILGLVSLYDDVKPLSPVLRLPAQGLAAGLVVFVAGYSLPATALPGLPLSLLTLATFLGVIWMINLYNFMDGMDGFAASMAIIGLGSLSLAALSAGAAAYALAGAMAMAAVAGFAVWNLPPARIFMGDVGSTFLGLLVAIFGLAGIVGGYFPLWVPALVFSPFWVDATYTLAKRISRREAFWQAHRSHFYQRLVLASGSHRKVLAGELALMLACAASAVLPALCGLGYNELIPLIWLGFYIGLIVFLEIRLGKEK